MGKHTHYFILFGGSISFLILLSIAINAFDNSKANFYGEELAYEGFTSSLSFSEPGTQKNVDMIHSEGLIWEIYKTDRYGTEEFKLTLRNNENKRLHEIDIPNCETGNYKNDKINPRLTNISSERFFVSWAEETEQKYTLCSAIIKYTARRLSSKDLLYSSVIEDVKVIVSDTKENLNPLLITEKFGGKSDVFINIWNQRKGSKNLILAKAYDSNGQVVKPKNSLAPMDLPFFYYSTKRVAPGWSMLIDEISPQFTLENMVVENMDVGKIRGVMFAWEERAKVDNSSKLKILTILSDMSKLTTPQHVRLNTLPRSFSGLDLSCSNGGICILVASVEFENDITKDLIAKVYNPFLKEISTLKRINSYRYGNQINPDIEWSNDLNKFIVAYETDWIDQFKENGLIIDILNIEGEILFDPIIVKNHPINTYSEPIMVTENKWAFIKYNTSENADVAFIRYDFNSKN